MHINTINRTVPAPLSRVISRLIYQWRVIALACVLLAMVTMVSFFFYMHASAQMREQLRSELRSIAAVTAANIAGDIVEQINGPEDMNSPFYHAIVRQLQAAREAGNNIRFAYILRRTDDPLVLEFVADADSLYSPEQLDVDGNGAVDPDEEASYPGELYDITGYTELWQHAFEQPTADESITIDQWGALISGYAPVRNSSGEVVAVFAIDMQAGDFITASNRIFSPAVLLLVLLLGLLASISVYVASEQRQIKLLHRINNERSGLLRLTFHQLGEPLTIMKWSLESLRDEADSPNLKHLIADHIICMDEGLGRLNSIIDTLQLAEKVDLNTLEYLPVPTSLRELLDNAVNEWSSSLRKRKQRMQVSLKQDIVLPVDKTLLMLVMRQILVNAIEYSNDKSVIRIDVRSDKNFATLSVRDEGCGIPQEDMKHLFEKYHRAGNAHLMKPDGNGLGLYISKGIIEKAGGRIWVESTENKGTTVNFTLPLS